MANNKMANRNVPILSLVCQKIEVHQPSVFFFLSKTRPKKGAVSLFINSTPHGEEIGAP